MRTGVFWLIRPPTEGARTALGRCGEKRGSPGTLVSSFGPVAPLLLRPLEAERAGPLLPVADDDVGVGPRDAVPTERRETSGAARCRGGRAAALRADRDERVLMRARPVVPDDDRGGRDRHRRLLQRTS